MSARAEWQQVAKDMFASFGDVIRSATVINKSLGGYDSATGSYTETTSSVTTSLVWRSVNRVKLPRPDLYESTDRMARVLGIDFVSIPSVTGTLTCDGVTYQIKEVIMDSAGTGAYYDLLVGK